MNPRWAEVFKTFGQQHIRHPDIRQSALIVLNLLKDLPLRHVGETSTGDLITLAPQWTCNSGHYTPDLMWEDVTYGGLESQVVSSRGNNVINQYTLGESFGLCLYSYTNLGLAQVINNWSANGASLDIEEAHINFVQIYHKSPRGIQTLQLYWPITPGLFFVDTMPGTSTFTQAGNITPPHVDGYGLTQRMAHFDGDKVWVVWPPTEENLRMVRDHNLSLGPRRENRLENWMKMLKDPQVFMMRQGDSFFLGASVIHACIAITPGAHYGVFCWRRESLDVAALNLSIFKDNLSALSSEQRKVLKRREVENKKKLSAVEKANRLADREDEDNFFSLSVQFYQGKKTEWVHTDSKAWGQIKKNVGQDEELDKYIKEATAFFKQIS